MTIQIDLKNGDPNVWPIEPESSGMSDDEILTFSHAMERDIDVLLVEELKCSPAFATWFVKAAVGDAGVPLPFSSAKIVHSKRRMMNRREIDIEVGLLNEAGGSAGVVFVENKLDTVEQPGQAESYREEAEHLVGLGVHPRAITVLTCPSGYAASHAAFAAKFDAVVSYEDVREFLAQRASTETGEIAARLTHRADLIRQAITKGRRPYDVVVSAPVSEFWSMYNTLCAEHFPRLKPGPALRRATAGGESKTAIFTNSPDWSFLPRTRLVHQLRESNANFCFFSWGGSASRETQMARDLSGSPYRLVKSKSASDAPGLMIATSTPFVDNLGDFVAQQGKIVEGMTKTLALFDWISERREMVERWSNSIAL